MKSLDKKKTKELDRTTEISIGELNRNKLVDEITSKELSKPKELDWKKEFVNEFCDPNDTGLINGYEESWRIKNFISNLLTQQRTELLDEQFEKSETEAEIASKAYDQGYLDCQKGRKKSPHDTRDGYCCACDYDLVCFEGKLKEARTELLEEILNLECLKEEEETLGGGKWVVKDYDAKAKNQLRTKIKEAIKKL